MAESTHNSVPSKHLNCVSSRSFDPKWNSTPGPCVPSPRAAPTAPGYLGLLFQVCLLHFHCRWVPGGCSAPTSTGGNGDLCHIISPTSLPPWIDNVLSQLEGVCLEQRGVITHHPAVPGFPGSRTGLSVLSFLCLLVPICQDFCNSAAPRMEYGCSQGVSACTARPLWGWRTQSIPREPRGGSCAQRRESQTLNRSSCTKNVFVSAPWGCLCVRAGDGAPHGGEGTSCKPPCPWCPAHTSYPKILPRLPPQTEGAPNPLPWGSQPFPSPREAQPHLLLPAQPPVCSTAHSPPTGALGSGSGRGEPQLIQGSIRTDCPRRQPAPCCGSPISPPCCWNSSLSQVLAKSTALGEDAQKPLLEPCGAWRREGDAGRAQAGLRQGMLVAGEAACAEGNPCSTR